MRRVLATTALLVVLCAGAATAATKPRGVMDEVASHYAGYEEAAFEFKCISDGKVIPGRYINDEYCDCADGSDEPGTAACTYLSDRAPTKHRFQCDNVGFIKTLIFHSRVNDGICDCCDGSDEYGGLVTCANNCAQAQEKQRKEAEEREATRQKGLSAKQSLLSEAATIKLGVASKLAEHKATLATVDAEIAVALKEKDEWETKETAEREVIHARSLKEKEVWDAEQAKKKAEQTAADEAAKAAIQEVDNATHTEDQGSVPPNVICTSWRQTKNCKGEGVRDSDFDKDCTTVIDSGASGFCECVDTRTGLDIKFPQDCGHRRLTCEKLCEAEGKPEGFLPDDAPLPPAEPTFTVDTGASFTLPEAADARRKHTDLISKKDEAERGVRELEEQVSGDMYGPESVFLALKGKCFDKNEGHYTYTICPFDRIKQGHTNMGNWKSWGEQTYGSWGGKHDFAKMIFNDGDRCWSGPARSVEVRVVCGPESRIINVDEPSMCTYKMVFETPAICE